MAKLTKEQKEFLDHHCVPLSRVFDASGLCTSYYKDIMKERDMYVAYGVTPCAESGHTLRIRSGHCFQCRPAGIAYLLRHNASGDVYIAISMSTGLVKIGVSTNPIDRARHLNGYSYGGANDWQIVESHSAENSGEIEFKTHKLLNQYRVDACYYDGREIDCHELFKCDLRTASKTLCKVIKDAK